MGVVSNDWFDRVLLNSLHARALMLTDVQTLFLGTPLVPLQTKPYSNEKSHNTMKYYTLFDNIYF